jgi:ribosomal protein S18 acetylase RimI-like enzyme
MDYAFEMCFAFGEVYLSEERNGCALLLFPERKRTTAKTILLDLKLVRDCIGFRNIGKALVREQKLNRLHPKESFWYLWFIGVDPAMQQQGVGSRLLQSIIAKSEGMKRPLYLETSVQKNITWYQRASFQLYQQLQFDYTLYCLQRPVSVVDISLEERGN